MKTKNKRLMKQRMILSGLLSLLLPISAFAQNPAQTTFTIADGLVDNSVSAIPNRVLL